MSKTIVISGHFVSGHSGALFITQFGEPQNTKTVLLLPSIFEEMNLSRAVLAKQAQALVEEGYCVYCLDYFGTGDSQGDTELANASIWQQDVLDCLTWLKSQGVLSVTLWGMRFGGLLLMQVLDSALQIMPVDNIVLWKPVTKGKQFMTQFLRLKQANSMMHSQQKVNWRDAIMAGQPTEVAGYEINASLLGSIDALELPKTLPESLSENTQISWLELSAKSITPAVTMAVKQWPEPQIHLSHFQGSAFWQIPEIFEQSFLHQATIDGVTAGEQGC